MSENTSSVIRLETGSCQELPSPESLPSAVPGAPEGRQGVLGTELCIAVLHKALSLQKKNQQLLHCWAKNHPGSIEMG